MVSNATPEVDVRTSLMAAIRASIAIAADIPGDVPSLLAHAYSKHFGRSIPSTRNRKRKKTPAVEVPQSEIESLLAMLRAIPPLEPNAQRLLDRARSILTDGPQLSMNVELVEGQELPTAMHTLLQGTLWACITASATPFAFLGNPDHNNVTYIPDIDQESRCVRFLCKKFFFTTEVANKDGGQVKFHNDSFGNLEAHRLYDGHLFVLDRKTEGEASVTRLRIPRAFNVFSSGVTHVAQTVAGLWGWGDNTEGHLGFQGEAQHPTRLTFPACPKVDELEASLPAWHKHELVLSMKLHLAHTVIHTAAGLVASGDGVHPFLRNSADSDLRQFKPVPLPDGLLPLHAIHDDYVMIISSRKKQAICGLNTCGELGLGHANTLSKFEDLPFHVDALLTCDFKYNVFLSGGQVLFAGRVPQVIAQSGLLPGYKAHNVCFTPTPLQLPENVKGWCQHGVLLLWTTEEETVFQEQFGTRTTLPFEVTAVIGDNSASLFRDTEGEWFTIVSVSERGEARVKPFGKFIPGLLGNLNALDYPVIQLGAWRAD
ncbi:hypothetical protein J8273_2723 [Carpediemonas membranifera]|uniref:Uncharacterized protein n=1 Tax=Carpediemonas membranifera TaxID=201153 RepID=A0A8J6BZS0_9EUKA|nr:hypothetical protein J8273_2723 [Carpediemonas membranifera]|eukprot:KAG9395811.1 hypothetical protein J8273_2723 [Carpediemonas membranifera]